MGVQLMCQSFRGKMLFNHYKGSMSLDPVKAWKFSQALTNSFSCYIMVMITFPLSGTLFRGICKYSYFSKRCLKNCALVRSLQDCKALWAHMQNTLYKTICQLHTATTLG